MTLYFCFQDSLIAKKARGIQSCTESMLHTFFEHSKLNSVRAIIQPAILAWQDCNREEDDIGESCSGESISDGSSANNMIAMSIPPCFLFVLPGGV